MALIAIKLEEKFNSFSKAFLFFDADGDQQVTRQEFHMCLNKMGIKLSKADIDKVFDYLDKDGDNHIMYHEFTEFSEEKRRKIDPF